MPIETPARVAQHIAPAPDRLDIIVAIGGFRELLAQLADEHVDDLQLRFIHAAVEMVQEHLLGQRGALAQAQQFQHLIFLAGQMHGLASGLDRLGIHIDGNLAGADHGLRMALGPADDRMDAGDQLFAVERLRHVIVRTGAEALDLVVGVIGTGQDQDRRFDPREPQLAQDLQAVHIRQVEVQKDQVVIVELGEVDSFLAKIGAIDVQIRVGQHQFDAARGRRIVLHQQDPHCGCSALITQSPMTVASTG